MKKREHTWLLGSAELAFYLGSGGQLVGRHELGHTAAQASKGPDKMPRTVATEAKREHTRVAGVLPDEVRQRDLVSRVAVRKHEQIAWRVILVRQAEQRPQRLPQLGSTQVVPHPLDEVLGCGHRRAVLCGLTVDE